MDGWSPPPRMRTRERGGTSVKRACARGSTATKANAWAIDLLGLHHHAVHRYLLEGVARALRVTLGEAGETGAIPLGTFLGEGGGEWEVAVEQIGGLLLHCAEAAFGFRLGRIGADLHVERPGIILLGGLLLSCAPGRCGTVGGVRWFAGVALAHIVGRAHGRGLGRDGCEREAWLARGCWRHVSLKL